MNSTPLIDIQGHEISFDYCSICFEKLENNKYQIQECKHEFHSECLLSFFRTGNTSCPLCRSTAPNNNINRSYGNMASEISLKAILNYSRKKNANKTIVNMVKKYKKLKQAEKDCKREFLEFKKKYKDVLKMRNELSSKRWKSSRKLREVKNNLSNIVVLPVSVRR